MTALLGIAACANGPAADPVGWWHDTLGGKIAKERPPPPGDKDPYPNLATVPPKPARPDATAMNRVTAGLIGDRIAAEHAAALAPIPPATAPAAPAAPSPPREDTASASFGAATRAPGAPNKGSPNPAPAIPTTQAQGDSGPVTPERGKTPVSPAPRATVAQRSPPATPAPQPSSPAQAANLPPLPTQEPAPAGAAIATPAPRPAAAPPPPPPETPRAPDGTALDFNARSATLNVTALERIKALAATRGQHGIAITGYGEAGTSDPLAQADALKLALDRAQAVATVLTAEGVPAAAQRLNAEAAGRGASIRLLQ